MGRTLDANHGNGGLKSARVSRSKEKAKESGLDLVDKEETLKSFNWKQGNHICII